MRQTYNSVHDVPYHLCEELEKASFGCDGLLYKSFREIKFEGIPRDGAVVIYSNKSHILGWGILLNYYVLLDYCDVDPEFDYTMMLFVHKPHRKRSIGRRIATELLKNANGEVFVWLSKDSGDQVGFFHRLNHPKIIKSVKNRQKVKQQILKSINP